jgi:hypothetical protein
MLYQDKHTTCHAYLEKFQNLIDVLEHCDGSIRQAPELTNMILKALGIDPSTATFDELMNARKLVQEQYLVVAFLLGVDCTQYGKIIEDL